LFGEEPTKCHSVLPNTNVLDQNRFFHMGEELSIITVTPPCFLSHEWKASDIGRCFRASVTGHVEQ
jgi:hypothetical protein